MRGAGVLRHIAHWVLVPIYNVVLSGRYAHLLRPIHATNAAPEGSGRYYIHIVEGFSTNSSMLPARISEIMEPPLEPPTPPTKYHRRRSIRTPPPPRRLSAPEQPAYTSSRSLLTLQHFTLVCAAPHQHAVSCLTPSASLCWQTQTPVGRHCGWAVLCPHWQVKLLPQGFDSSASLVLEQVF